MSTDATLTPDSNRKPFFGGDKHLWGIYIALCLISIVELYSASSREVTASSIGVYGPVVRHVCQLLGGFLIVLFVQKVHYRHFAPFIIVFTIFSIFMMIYVIFKGETINGANRSFNFIITVQPSEFIKISAVSLIALVMALTQSDKDSRMRNTGVLITVGAVTLFMILLIRDGFTNTMILMAISMAMMLIGGIKIKQFLLVVVAYCALGGGYYFVTHKFMDKADEEGTEMVAKAGETQHIDRTQVRDNRWAQWNADSIPKYEMPITAENQQEMYSYMAQANGGVLGVFPGNSRETSRLPLAFSDFIFSIIVEDIGLIGGLCVLILFLWLLARASGIASRCHGYFPMLLVIGMAVMIVTQALTHMAIVTGVVPVSGQPLPLISKGGTSILITSLAFGVMLSVSRYAVSSGKKKEIKAEQEAMPENLRGENPSQLA